MARNKMMIIYKITNLINSKIYIGQTKRSIEVRWKAHITESKHQSRSICRAIKKYGPDNFKIETIAIASEQWHIDKLEQYWIEKLDTMNPTKGYNLRAGGNTATFCKETRKKMSEKKKGKPAPWKRIPMPDSHFQKLKPFQPGHKPWNKGIPRTEEQNKAHSEKMKGRPAHNKGLRYNNKPIVAINLTTNEEIEFSSIHEVVEKLNVGRAAVQNVLSGRAVRTKNNFTYKYKAQ